MMLISPLDAGRQLQVHLLAHVCDAPSAARARPRALGERCLCIDRSLCIDRCVLPVAIREPRTRSYSAFLGESVLTVSPIEARRIRDRLYVVTSHVSIILFTMI